MLELRWVVGGIILGMLISTVMIPPTRKTPSLPQPNDPSVYHAGTGCVRFDALEVPCNAEPDSLNLLASR